MALKKPPIGRDSELIHSWFPKSNFYLIFFSFLARTKVRYYKTDNELKFVTPERELKFAISEHAVKFAITIFFTISYNFCQEVELLFAQAFIIRTNSYKPNFFINDCVDETMVIIQSCFIHIFTRHFSGFK